MPGPVADSAYHVSVFHLERRERRVVGSCEARAQFRVGQAKGCQVELCAILEQLHAIDEAVGTVRLRREARPPPSTSRLVLRAFEGSKVGRSAWSGATIPSSDVAASARAEGQGPRQLAQGRPARSGGGAGELPVADNRQGARREARPCGQEVHLKLCRPRP